MRAMNKKDLAKAVAEAAEISLAEADQQVDSVLSAIADALQAGEEVRLPGFGTFGVVTRPARTGRNPSTGAKIEVRSARVPRFKAAPRLKARINGDPTTDP
jgi:DNA-binding protein HU-beta